MGRTTISWGDGSGDNIYLDYNALEGTQTVTVSSDANSGSSSRTKTITFSTTGATPVTQTLTVTQAAESADLIIITRSDVAISHNETALGYKAATPIYELPAEVSSTYDTGVKLFDTPKSFTIYVDATFKNYNWSGNQGIIGIGTSTLFRLGRIASGKDYQSGEISATANRYTALIMNTTTSGKNCSSMLARNSVNYTRQFVITYNATTRKITGYVNANSSTAHWWIVSDDLISDDTLKCNVDITSSCTVHDLKVYDYCMTDEEALSMLE